MNKNGFQNKRRKIVKQDDTVSCEQSYEKCSDLEDQSPPSFLFGVY